MDNKLKYYLRYLSFLLPALVISIFSEYIASVLGDNPAIVLQWFFAFFMLIGFGVSTASFGYRFPRAAMSFILCYTGLNLLIITFFYSSQYGTPLYSFLRYYAGALSYVPLEIMVEALLDFNIQQEVCVTLIVTAFCLIGYLAGLVHRRVSPSPYRPTIG